MAEIPTVIIQVEGGAITEAEWNRLGDKLKAAWHEHVDAAVAAERERIAKLAERVGATRTERCRDPEHAQMIHAIRALGSGGGHEVPFADVLRDEVVREAEVLHAEHHSGTFVPSLDACTEHDRAAYERIVRAQIGGDQA